ncbi:outer membrane assembly protein AsmA [Budvicia diplopodorum]|uniref:outer membrane assembly protein AsmA n=1 Tax=Budvicia diplopodorum TaxID=1119056 RepID=UPI0013584839|nr:outer membrane assembly protein AsmA [Budvicia diplopodorum]
MRRFLTALAILLVVVIAGMSALVLLVNPNDFRGYMVKKVEDKTGYQLKIDGDLRWHAWPQLSILAGQVTLTAPGAKTPILGAENMRLDVELLPLLSHQLSVKNVVLKGGVIQLIPDSRPQRSDNAPIAPDESDSQSKSPVHASASAWSLELDKIEVADSLLVWQRGDNDVINVRDINLTLSRTDSRRADITAKAWISRDQRELKFSLDGALDLNKFPHEINLDISDIDYQLSGAGVPVDGIKGNSAFKLAYLSSPQSVHLSPFTATFNDNQITADISASLGDVPQYDVKIQSDSINLDQLFLVSDANTQSTGKTERELPSPVVSSANGLSESPDLTFLKQFDGSLSVNVDTLTYKGIAVRQVVLEANNQQGMATIENLQAKLAGGAVNVTGTVDSRGKTPQVTIKPRIQNIALGEVITAMKYPETLTGQLSMQGTFSSSGHDILDLQRGWQGNAHISVIEARLRGLNIQQIIQQAVARSNNDVQGKEHYDRYTEVKELVVDTVFSQGQIKVTRLNGESELLTVAGTGSLDLPGKSCDMNLNIRVTQGWSGKSDVIKMLQNTTIPLRIYGPWSKLNYQLNVEQILRDQIKDKMGQAIDKWINKNQDKKESKDAKKLLDKLL